MNAGRLDDDAMALWDFARRCQRADGSYYGTAGQCRKGKEVGEKEVSQSAPSRSSLNEYWQERAEMSEAKANMKISKEIDMFAPDGIRPNEEWYKAAKERMKPYSDLPPDEKAAVQMYGAEGNREKIFSDLNAKLRSGKEPPDEKKDAVAFTEAHLKKALDKLPDTEGKFYRAICCEGANAFEGLKPGDVIADKGFGSYADRGGSKVAPFLSTSDKNIVVILNGKTLKNVSPIMPYQEGEHLTRPGTKMRLVDVQEKGFYSRKVGDVMTYVFEEV